MWVPPVEWDQRPPDPMKPTQKPTLFHMHPLLSFCSSPPQRPAPFRTRTRHFLLDRLQLTSFSFHHPSFPQPQIVGACVSGGRMSTSSKVGGINQEEAAGTPKSCLQRISLGNFKGREGLILPRFCVCPARGPASTAVDHLWQLPGVTDAPVLGPGKSLFRAGPPPHVLTGGPARLVC